jgi:sugar phosphate permease
MSTVPQSPRALVIQSLPSESYPSVFSVFAISYAAYGVSMVLRLMPAFAANAMRSDPAIQANVTAIGAMLASGTTGALCGKFLWGWAADRWGAKRVFPLALLIESFAVAVFSQAQSMGSFQAAFFVTLLAQAAGWPCLTRIVQNWAPPGKAGLIWGSLSTSSRVATLAASLGPAALAGFLPWRDVLLFASAIGAATAIVAFKLLPPETAPDERAQRTTSRAAGGTSANASPAPHPFANLSLAQTLLGFITSTRFLLMAAALLGLAVLWDFLLLAPMMLRDGLQLTNEQALQAVSAVPFGSLISLCAGGLLFDKLTRRGRAIVMGSLTAAATLCLTLFAALPALPLAPATLVPASTGLLFVFGLCLSPCYYIPVSVFSTEFGGPRCGILVAVLDAIGFAAVAVFCLLSGPIVEQLGWPSLLLLLTAIGLTSSSLLLMFLLREARILPTNQE